MVELLGGMASDVIPLMAESLDLSDAQLSVINHAVGKNWRERYQLTADRLMHLEESLRQDMPLRCWRLSPSDVPEFVKQTHCAQGSVFSLCSRLRHRGRVLHLPLLNLHPAPELSEDDLIDVLSATTGNMPGCLLATGRYYHFYGLKILSVRHWERLMAQTLMSVMLVSPRYIGHCIYRGYSTVRLSTDDNFKPSVPRVVRVV
jgi:hypothetical protein